MKIFHFQKGRHTLTGGQTSPCSLLHGMQVNHTDKEHVPHSARKVIVRQRKTHRCNTATGQRGGAELSVLMSGERLLVRSAPALGALDAVVLQVIDLRQNQLSISRSLCARASRVKGFCRKGSPRAIASSRTATPPAYPETYNTL